MAYRPTGWRAFSRTGPRPLRGEQHKEVSFGVFQGGTLGPTMFNLLTNDTVSHIQFGHLFSYVEDSQLVHCAKPDDLFQLKCHIEDYLCRLARWFNSNGLKVNPTKTEFLITGTTANTTKVSDWAVSFQCVPLRIQRKSKFWASTSIVI